MPLRALALFPEADADEEEPLLVEAAVDPLAVPREAPFPIASIIGLRPAACISLTRRCMAVLS